MHVMFVHQNFPAQFRYIAARLIADFGWQVSYVTERAEGELPGVQKYLYKARGGASISNHVCTRNFENTVAHAHGVYEDLKPLTQLKPDLIVAHSGFGSSLFLPYLFDAPIINFLEYFYHPYGQDMGFRPEVPVPEVDLLRIKTKNAMILLDVVNCDRGWTPTHYQRAFFPPELQDKIDVIFDGIDTAVYHRKPGANERVRRQYEIDPNARVVTYVARGFEMMRGFDVFMDAARRIAEKRPDVIFIVVGTDRIHYGADANYIKEKSFREHVLKQGNFDLTRFRFTGYVAQETLADILSMSQVHIYLTEPFIASWSMVDAMACGAVVLASDQTCVREYIEPGVNGLLTSFFDAEALAEKAIAVLDNPAAYEHVAAAAMHTVSEKYSLDVAMPKLKTFFEGVAAKPRTPTQLMSKLSRPGTLKRTTEDPDIAGSRLAAGLPGAAGNANAAAAQSGAAGSSAGDPASQAAVGGGQVAPQTAEITPSNTGDGDLDLAIDSIRRLLATPRTIGEWIALCQTWRGPAPRFTALGPLNHPQDIARLAQRASEWKPQTIVEVGTNEGGTLFLFCRIAVNHALLIAAGAPGADYPADKAPFFKAMARAEQTIECITGVSDGDALARKIEKALNGRKIDILFIHGRRPFKDVQGDYRRLKKKVRSGGLIAWDGIQPAGTPGPEADGGDKLWTEVRPQFSQRAEYLSGSSTEYGGIAVIKV